VQRGTDGGDEQRSRHGERVHKTESVICLSSYYRAVTADGAFGGIMVLLSDASDDGAADCVCYRKEPAPCARRNRPVPVPAARAECSPPESAVLPRVPARNYLLRPSYFGTSAPARPHHHHHRRPTDNHIIIFSPLWLHLSMTGSCENIFCPSVSVALPNARL